MFSRNLTAAGRFLWAVSNSRPVRVLRAAVAWQPLTPRGFVAALLSAYAIYAWAVPEADLVAAMVGGTILGLCALGVLAALLLRCVLGRRLRAEFFFDQHAFSRQPTAAGIVLHQSSIPPFFSLAVKRRFAAPGVSANEHTVTGRDGGAGKRRLIDHVIFPHRGLWSTIAVEFSLRDLLGFTHLSWSRECSSALEVTAPTIRIKPLPVLAASSRIGDQWNQARERTGDLFDIKAYDPSDGIKRILWKTYAKSRQLVVRRPEPAIIPEGEVALYLIAAREDDHVAGAVQSYIDQLHRHQITVLFGTDGMDAAHTGSFSGPASGPIRFCSEPREIQKAINYSVWSEESGTGAGFERYLESLKDSNRIIHQAVIFSSADAKKENSGQKQDWTHALLSVAAAHYVKLSVAMVPQSLAADGRADQNRRQANGWRTAMQKLKRMRKGTKARPAAPPAAALSSGGVELVQVEGHE